MLPEKPSHSASSEELYDLYIDACLEGGAVESPDAFCARHGVGDPRVVEQLRQLHEASTRRAVPQPQPRVPFTRLGEFRLVRPLDEGGMGVVYEAVQESLGRRVALKLVRPEYASSEQVDKRFRREALAIGKLRHPNIVDVFGSGEDNGVRYIAMELLTGETLEQRLERRRARDETVPMRQLLEWFVALARALQHAHDAGIVHRDVKPSNIHITPDDRPLLLDFGIARDTRAQTGTLTRTFAGSAHYAAPEQIMGRDDVDGRVDVYALGVSLYRALTGRVPFEGGSLDGVVKRVLSDDPLAPRRLNPAVSRDLETVILKAIERESARRYRTAAAFADDMLAVLEDRPVQARRASWRTRATRWCRRHRAAATAIATGVVMLIASLVYVRVQRHRDMRGLLQDAQNEITTYRERREATRLQQVELAQLQRDMTRVGFAGAKERRLNELERGAEQFRRSRERIYHAVLDTIRNAEALGASPRTANGLRAQLYMERWDEAKAAGDTVAEEHYALLVRRWDDEKRFADKLGGVHTLEIRITQSDAEIYLFRCVLQSDIEPNGEPRLVYVPFRGATPVVPYGTHALRVLRDFESMREDDLIVELNGYGLEDVWFVDEARAPVRRGDRFVRAGDEDYPTPFVGDRQDDIEFEFERDGQPLLVRGKTLAALGVTLATPMALAKRGGMRATVVRAGKKLTMTLPSDVPTRPTARPFLAWAQARVTGAKAEVEKGHYVVVAKKRGYVTLRALSRPGMRRTPPMTMVRRADAHDGFVHVPRTFKQAPFWIMEREVSIAEYLEFLRDPEVRRAIDASQDAIYFPRFSRNTKPGGYLPYRAGEPIELPFTWAPDWPALGVSWHDAQAFAAWKTRRARAAGRAVTYQLPTYDQWMLATGGVTGWDYPWGESFRPRYCNGCRSHQHAFAEPSLQYPVDETVYGLFDCTGNVSEWLLEYYDKTRDLRRLGGGNWGATQPISFRINGSGGDPNGATGTYGFRLVALEAK